MNCLNCNEQTKNPKFCSLRCSAIYNNKQPSHINSRRKKTKKCKKCDNLIYSGRIHCDNCKRYREENQCSDSKYDYMTIAELSYGTEQEACNKYTKIRDRAKTKYKNSKKPKTCLICGYSLHCDICHIKPISKFDKDTKVSEVNDINNLVALCKNHHWEFDKGHISEEKLRILMAD